MNSLSPSRRSHLRWLLLPMVALTALCLASSPAFAHQGKGTLTLLSSTAAGPLVVDYEVKLVFVADGHGPKDATVTVVADGPGGSIAPVTMEPAGEDGLYRVSVQFPAPGDWNVRFTSVTPAATLEQASTVEPPAPAETATASPTTATETARSHEGHRPRPDSQVPTVGDTNVEDSSGPAAPVNLVAGAVAVLCGGAFVFVRRNRAL